MPDNPTPEILKRIKMDIPPAPRPQNEKGRRRTSVAEDEEDADFAPGGDADYFVDEDEEGRFYGGGLTQEQKQILNIFDSAAGEGPSEEVGDPFFSRNSSPTALPAGGIIPHLNPPAAASV